MRYLLSIFMRPNFDITERPKRNLKFLQQQTSKQRSNNDKLQARKQDRNTRNDNIQLIIQPVQPLSHQLT